MEDPLLSDWPELENWAHCQETLGKDCSFDYYTCFNPSSVPHGGAAGGEDGSAAASTVSKNHSQAEKRRRDRINEQLSLLRNLIPDSDKMDKAALLGCVVQQVKDLKQKAKEVSRVLAVPSDLEEVAIDCFLNQDRSSVKNGKTDQDVFIRASICCNDRPELFAELTQAVKSLSLRIIRADMTCLGGRIRSILVLHPQNGEKGVYLNGTIQSLRGALGRIASSTVGPTCARNRSKRQRFFSSG